MTTFSAINIPITMPIPIQKSTNPKCNTGFKKMSFYKKRSRNSIEIMELLNYNL